MKINEKLINKEYQDYIVETGTDGIWTYHKWNSGVLDLWTTIPQKYDFTGTTQWGSLYETAAVYYTYPTGLLITDPFVSISKSGGVGGLLEIGGGGSMTRTPSVYGVFTSSKSSGSIYISVYAIGKWK